MISRKIFRTKFEFFLVLIQEPDVNGLAEHLQSNPNLVLEQDEEGKTLLHYAVGNYEAVYKLKPYITKEALSIQDQRGRTPLHLYTASHYTLDALSLILSAYLEKIKNSGFDFTIKDKSGNTPLHCMIMYCGRDKFFKKPINLVKDILQFFPKIDLNIIGGTGTTALGLALHLENYEVVELLLENGANPAIFDDSIDPAYDTDPFKIIGNKIKIVQEEISLVLKENNEKKEYYKERYNGTLFADVFNKKLIDKQDHLDYLESIKSKIVQTAMRINFKPVKST